MRPLFDGSRLERTTAYLAWGYLAMALLAWGALYFTSEKLLPGTIIVYGPRWLALWPLVVLVPLSAFASRKTFLPLLIAAIVVVHPIMGARISPTTLFSDGLPKIPAAGTFRLLTFNTEGGDPLSHDLAELVRDDAPDIVAFQECNEQLWEALQAIKDWHSVRDVALCTASRWPITATEIMPRGDLARISRFGFGGAGYVMRTYIATPHGPLVFVNLHLETARKGLEGLLGKEGFVPDMNSTMTDLPNTVANSEIESSANRFQLNAEIRMSESARASRWISPRRNVSPVIVAGDFNLPVESSIFREYWGQFTDAFEAKGNGLGWSKREGRWLRIRIDHVLSNDNAPQPIGIVLGHDFQSDHLPVIVDFAWPTAKGSTH